MSFSGRLRAHNIRSTCEITLISIDRYLYIHLYAAGDHVPSKIYLEKKQEAAAACGILSQVRKGCESMSFYQDTDPTFRYVESRSLIQSLKSLRKNKIKI